jgi:Cof subfamily protein (haloacid dehalogenase superfamily)
MGQDLSIPSNTLDFEIEKGHIKAALFDVDGTLIGRSGKIGDLDLQALARIQAAGVRVGFATGRALIACRELTQQIKPTLPSIFFSGAIIALPTNGEVLHACPLGLNELRQVLDLVPLYPTVTFELYTRAHYCIEQITPIAAIHSQHYLQVTPTLVNFSEMITREPVFKVCISGTALNVNSLVAEIQSKISTVTVTHAPGSAHPELFFINITAKEASRALALERLLTMTSLSTIEVAAFGDSDQDIPMLAGVHFGVAMANASAGAKAAARFETRTVEENGVAYALNRLIN